jgi:hypothetical protein
MEGRKVTVDLGLGTGTLVFVIFLILKVLSDNGSIAKIEWLSWFWVFFPLWIGIAVVIGFFVLFMVIGVIFSIIDAL